MEFTMNTTRLVVFTIVSLCSALSQAQFGPIPDANPWVGMHGAASMHGDTASSDTTPLSGPGGESIRSKHSLKLGACSTILIRQDGKPMVLCTAWLGRNPTVHLLDKNSWKMR